MTTEHTTLSEQNSGGISASQLSELQASLRKVVAEEEDRRFQQLRRYIAVVAFVGIGSFAAFVSSAIDRAVDSRLGVSTLNPAEFADYLRYSTLVGTMFYQGENVDYDQLESVTNYLLVSAKSERVRSFRGYQELATRALDLYISRSRHAAVDQLYSALRDEILRNQFIAEDLVRYYGSRLIHEPVPVSNSNPVLLRFEELERVARRYGKGAALGYRFIHTFRNRSDQHSGDNVQRLQDLILENDYSGASSRALEILLDASYDKTNMDLARKTRQVLNTAAPMLEKHTMATRQQILKFTSGDSTDLDKLKELLGTRR